MKTSQPQSNLDYLIIGHLTRDKKRAGFQLGGTVAYAGLTAKAFSLSVGILTSFAPGLDLSPLDGLQIQNVPADQSTTFNNKYINGNRRQQVLAIAKSITKFNIPQDWQDAPVVHIGPVLDETPHACRKIFPHSFIGITPQGWLRRVDSEGKVNACSWESLPERIQGADAVVLSRADLDGDMAAADALASACPLLIITDAGNQVHLYMNSKHTIIPVSYVHEVDPTGAGDIFAAAFFLAYIQYRDPVVAVRFAHQVAAPSVTRVGLSAAPSQDEILSIRTSTNL